MLEAFPYVDLNLGPGSMAAYFSAEPHFSLDTVWYDKYNVDSIDELPEFS